MRPPEICARVALAMALGLGCAHRPVTPAAPAAEPSLTTATAVAHRFIERHPPSRLDYGWESAIFTLGLARLAEVDDAHADAWRTYLAEHYRAHERARIRRPDDCAPALAAAWLLRHDEPAGRPAVERTAAYLRQAPRNPLGALDHLDPRTPLGRLYPPSIWVDSLVMYGLTAAWVGEATDDPELQRFALRQPAIFARRLQDPSTGLFRHAYLHRRGYPRPQGDVFWLRGNGWVALALVELLALADPSQPEYLPTRVIVRRLAEGLVAHRSPDGLWTTVIDAPRTYPETSGTALVAFALAKGARLGLLPAEYRAQAQQTLQTLEARLRTRRDGPAVGGTSGPTIPSTRAGYAMVPRRTDVPYGVGAYLLLAAELAQEPTTTEEVETHGHIGSSSGP